MEIDGMRLSHVADYVALIPARYKILILDHCFSGEAGGLAKDLFETASSRFLPAVSMGGSQPQFRRVLKSRNLRTTDGFQQQLAGHATGAVVLGASWDLAKESKERKQGYFTAALLDAMRSGAAKQADTDEDRLSALELVNYVQQMAKKVREDAANKPLPQLPDAVPFGNDQQWTVLDLASTPEQIQTAVRRYRELVRQLEQATGVDVREQARGFDAINQWQRHVCPTAVVVEDGIERCKEGGQQRPAGITYLEASDYELISLLTRLSESSLLLSDKASLYKDLVARQTGAP
jgi:hypothetical protein